MGSLLFRERGSPGRALPRHGERKRTCVEECVGERTPVPGLTVREVEMLTQTQRIVVDDGDARGEVLLLDHHHRSHRHRGFGPDRGHRLVVGFPRRHVRQRIGKREARSTGRVAPEIEFRLLGRGGERYGERCGRKQHLSHNLEVQGSSPGWSTLRIKHLQIFVSA